MYPLNWKAEGAPCLVIGAGHVAVRKISHLLSAGANVTVIAPDLAEEILSWEAAGNIVCLRRSFSPGDEAGFAFVVTTSGAADVAAYISERAEERHFLYNAADFPALGNCAVPAVLRRGSLTVALSTEGKSPAFSRYIKHWLAGEIPENYGEWLDRLAVLRAEGKERLQEGSRRERFWRAAFGPDVMALVSEGHLEEAEEQIRHAMGCFGTEP